MSGSGSYFPGVEGGGGASEAVNGDVQGIFPNALIVKKFHDGLNTTISFGTILDGAVCQRSGTTLVGTFLSAAWDVTKVRYYLLDQDGGNDNNVGFIDATAGSTIDPTGLALKTHAALFTLLPLHGNRRRVVILTKNRANGATYLGTDNTTPEDVDFSAYASGGWTIFLVRGSSDLTNSATDRTRCGFITAVTGPNGNGSWTVGAGPTTTTIPVDAAQTLSAEASQLGYRIRVATGTRAEQCRYIQSNTTGAGGVLSLGQATSGAVTQGDTFFIEKPGVRVNTFTYMGPMPGGNFTTFSGIPCFVGYACVKAGIGFVITQVGTTFPTYMAGCDATDTTASNSGFFITNCTSFTAGSTYTDEAGGGRNVGMGLRCGNGYTFANIYSLTLSSSYLGGTNVSFNIFQNILNFAIGASGFYWAGRSSWTRCGAVPVRATSGSGSGGFLGSGTAAIKCRSNGGFQIQGSAMQIYGVDYQNCSSACVAGAALSPGGVVYMDNMSGSSGNTARGIDFTSSVPGGILGFGTLAANTVTGSSGDIRIGAINVDFTHADIAAINGFRDQEGVLIYGTNNAPFQPSAEVVPMINNSGVSFARGEICIADSTSTTQPKFKSADASAQVSSDGVLGPVCNAAANAARAMVQLGSMRVYQFASAPTAGQGAYLDPATPRQAKGFTNRTAGPATGFKVRLGVVVAVNGTLGLVVGKPDQFSVASDGTA